MSVAVVVVAVGALVLGLGCLIVGLLGSVRRLPRNHRVGVRAPATLVSDTAFVTANRVAGPGIAGGGVLAIGGGLLGLGLGNGVGLAACLLCVGVAVAVAGLVSGYGIRAAAALPPEPGSCGTGGCGSCALQNACAADSSLAQP